MNRSLRNRSGTCDKGLCSVRPERLNPVVLRGWTEPESIFAPLTVEAIILGEDTDKFNQIWSLMRSTGDHIQITVGE